MTSGFYISCIMNREDRGWREFSDKVSLLMAKKEKMPFSANMNFQKALTEELRSYKPKASVELLERHKGVLFAKNLTNINPSEIFKLLRETEARFSNVLRIIPLDLLIKFDEQRIKNTIQESCIEGSFKIMFEGRLCEKDIKEKIFEIIIPNVGCKVDLENPRNVIVVQAFKNFIGLSVIKNDDRNFNFNQMLIPKS